MLAFSYVSTSLTFVLNLLFSPESAIDLGPSTSSAPVDLTNLFNSRAARSSDSFAAAVDSFDGQGGFYPADAGCLPPKTYWTDGIEVNTSESAAANFQVASLLRKKHHG